MNICRYSLFFLFAGIMVSCASQGVVPVACVPNMQDYNKSGVVVGKKVNTPKMIYPKKAFLIGQEGWVLVKASINTMGVPKKVEVIDYSPSEEFIPFAKKYVRESRYKPYEKDGDPVEVEGHFFLVEFEIGTKHPQYRKHKKECL